MASLNSAINYELHTTPQADDELEVVLTPKTIRHYAFSRIPSLFSFHNENINDINPIPALKEMTPMNWNYFMLGTLSWFSASFDFFLTSVCGTQIAASLNVSTSDITWGLSAVLMVRSAGAVLFGFWTDKYSRKWPYITACALFLILQIATGFVKTYQQFLAVRALSGVAMGGTYGTSSATSLEDAPLKARSFLSGLFFTAYPFGMVFAAVFWKAFQGVEHTWKALFWFSSAFPAILIAWRLMLPETKYFTKVLKARVLMKQDSIEAGTYVKPTLKSKLRGVGAMCKKHWVLFIYLILLMTAPNYLAHATQDLYPTMLRKQLKMSEDKITVAIVVYNLGGAFGSVIVGALMELFGRRLSILFCCILGGAVTYPAFMVHKDAAILTTGFLVQFSVFGIWGVMPIHLSELAPSDARVLVSGLAYQLGNLASSAASTIETTLAKQWPLEFNAQGIAIKLDYAKVMAILTGATFIYTFFITIAGPERFHRDLSSPMMKQYIARVDGIEKIQVDGIEKKIQDKSSDASSYEQEDKFSNHHIEA